MARSSKTAAGKQRWICKGSDGQREHCYSTTNPKQALRGRARPAKAILFRRTLGGVTRLIVSAAQNATPEHSGFRRARIAAANHLGAELLTVPFRYKNVTSTWTESQENAEFWDVPDAELCNQRKRLGPNLVLLGDVPVQPTATAPLTGFDAMTHGESGLLGHSKVQLKTIPTPQGQLPKIMATTGACTVPNYTDSRAGKLGEFHHTLGAVMVELQGKKFHLRQINADADGAFTDLGVTYGSNGRTRAAERPLALDMGDTHVDYIDPRVERATFGPGGMVETLRPRHLIWNDLCDGYAVNPHHFGNMLVAMAKNAAGRNDVRGEVERSLTFVERHTPANCVSVIVPSNHNDFLTRWLIATDARSQTLDNFRFYCETALAVAETLFHKDGYGAEYTDAFTYWAERLLPKDGRFKVLRRDESFTLGGVEHGMHGDVGPNGARGSIKNLRRIGVRSTIGHSHSPGIDEGCHQVGTSTRLRAEYTRGPSSWLNTHSLQYASTKRTLINIIDGDWRL